MYNRQNIRLGVICLWLGLILLLATGHELLARGAFTVINYLCFWPLLAIQHDFVQGPICIALGIFASREKCVATFVTIPASHFFDSSAQNISCVCMLVGNVAGVFATLFVFPVRDNIVMTPAETNRAVITMLLAIVLGTCIMSIFNSVSHAVYEEVKNSHAKIEANTAEKEAFMATVSHEIRNPLQSLAGSVDLLRDMNVTKETRASLLEICKNCSEIVLNLVSNILDMSKTAAGKMQFNPAAADLREIVNRILRISHSRAGAKGLSLGVLDDPSLPPALDLDKQRVEQILLNIVSNAIKFTSNGRVLVKLDWLPLPRESSSDRDISAVLNEALSKSNWKEIIDFNEGRKGPLRLRRKYLECHPPSVREKLPPVVSPGVVNRVPGSWGEGTVGVAKIQIMDTGIGISKENRKRLFRAYQQADSGISRSYGGTGLGLWITKNILQWMQGSINVKSKEGKGSNFILAFPARVCKEIPAFSDSLDFPTRANEFCCKFKGKTALVVDDVPESVFLTQQILTKYGIVSTSRQNGAAALEEFKASRPSIVITDLRMPMMTGQTLIAEIRKLEAGARIKMVPVPILVVTAESSTEEKRLCLNKYGADEYLVKPVKYQDLLAAVGKMLTSTRKAEAQTRRILIVDDDVLSAGFLRAVLEADGHQCIVEHSVKDVCELRKKSGRQRSGSGLSTPRRRTQ